MDELSTTVVSLCVSWMGLVQQFIHAVCSLTESKQIKDQENSPNEFKPYYKTWIPVNQGTHCRNVQLRNPMLEYRFSSRSTLGHVIL